MTIDWPSSEREVSVLSAGDGVDRFLDLAADLALDRLGRGAGIIGGDDHDREVDVGELVDAELA